MTTTDCVHCDELSALVEAAHEQALTALIRQPSLGMDAVAWLAAHLGAVEAVIDDLLRRHAIAPPATLHEQRSLNRDLLRELRLLEQILAGDALVRRADLEKVRDALLQLLSEHAAAEHLLLEQLARGIGADAASDAARRYQRALAAGPTRPHTHLPTSSPLVGGLARRVARARDHALDVLDGRRNPLPRQRRRPDQPGRWGQYVLGASLGMIEERPPSVE